jgi:hypothetical protein
MKLRVCVCILDTEDAPEAPSQQKVKDNTVRTIKISLPHQNKVSQLPTPNVLSHKSNLSWRHSACNYGVGFFFVTGYLNK